MNLSLAPFAGHPFSAWLDVIHAPRRQAAGRISPPVQGPMTIDRGATLAVERAIGASVCCISGSLWITHDGDPKDILIEAGETYRSDRSARMLVHGLAASTALVS